MRTIVQRDEFTHWLRVLLVLGTLIASIRPVDAHSLGEGYIFIDVSDSSLSGWVEITLMDLDAALSIDGNSGLFLPHLR